MPIAPPYAKLVGQRLTAMQVFEPWKGLLPKRHGLVAPAIFGAILLTFDRLALICTSPLRYQRSQHGTAVCAASGETVVLGYRVTLCDREAVEALLPMTFGMTDRHARWQQWDDQSNPLIGCKVLAAAVMGESGAGGAMPESIELTLDLRAPLRITYRPDLDGGIELAEPGKHLTIDHIVVLSPDDDFGWLHPAAPLAFILNDQVWRSAQVTDWPAPLRKLLNHSQEPESFYRETLQRALMARFLQRPMHRQRLSALQYPVHCSDIPRGLIEELALRLREPSVTAAQSIRDTGDR